MAVTWEKIKKCKDYNLEIKLLQEIESNLRENRRVHVGAMVLTKQDLKDIQKLIDRQLETIKAE